MIQLRVMFAELSEAKDAPWADATLRGSFHKMALQGEASRFLFLATAAPRGPGALRAENRDRLTRAMAPCWNICSPSSTFPHL